MFSGLATRKTASALGLGWAEEALTEPFSWGTFPVFFAASHEATTEFKVVILIKILSGSINNKNLLNGFCNHVHEPQYRIRSEV